MKNKTWTKVLYTTIMFFTIFDLILSSYFTSHYSGDILVPENIVTDEKITFKSNKPSTDVSRKQ